MRALQFNIEVGRLLLDDFHDIHRKDLDYIISQASRNNLSWHPDDVYIVFMGKGEDLFHFLYEVAFRYDIEIL